MKLPSYKRLIRRWRWVHWIPKSEMGGGVNPFLEKEIWRGREIDRTRTVNRKLAVPSSAPGASSPARARPAMVACAHADGRRRAAGCCMLLDDEGVWMIRQSRAAAAGRGPVLQCACRSDLRLCYRRDCCSR